MMCLPQRLSIVDPCKTPAPSVTEESVASVAVAANLSGRHPQTPHRRDRENPLLSSRQRHSDASFTRPSSVSRITRNDSRLPPREVVIGSFIDVASLLVASRYAHWSPAFSRRPPLTTRCHSHFSFCFVAASHCFSLRKTHADRRHCVLTR